MVDMDEILELNERVSKAKEKRIRLQTRRETLQKTLDDLIDEIKAAGYDPAKLKDEKGRLEKELNEQKEDLEKRLEAAEKQLESIPE